MLPPRALAARALCPDKRLRIPLSWFRVRLCAPQLDFVLQLYPVLAAEALAYLFGQPESLARLRALALGDDEVGVDGRDDGAAAAFALHPHLVDHLPRAQPRA